MTQRLSRPLWLLFWDGEGKGEIFFSFREGEPEWRRRETVTGEGQRPEPRDRMAPKIEVTASSAESPGLHLCPSCGSDL